ncbi:helix-turn-helix domain-containing protein [Actinokineospora terrae]|uniref:Helix-turn-helix domain-containing protein n=1 Tax=Actinokineospora terrae TaxID=155974 RepID=A0A1H9MAW5_9PSEU|nr:helix-turn-helix transcriptional regulator [Actinokineospora terrae]SER20890.1 Helix-turn-helix domain-containing protein [Actinokineospora terrae]
MTEDPAMPATRIGALERGDEILRLGDLVVLCRAFAVPAATVLAVAEAPTRPRWQVADLRPLTPRLHSAPTPPPTPVRPVPPRPIPDRRVAGPAQGQDVDRDPEESFGISTAAAMITALVAVVARRAGKPAPAHTGGGSVAALDVVCRRYGMSAAGVLAALEGATPEALRDAMTPAARSRTRRSSGPPPLVGGEGGAWADELLHQAPVLTMPAAVVASNLAGVPVEQVVADAGVAARALGEAAAAGALPVPLALLRGRAIPDAAVLPDGYGQVPSCPDTVGAALAALLRQARDRAGVSLDAAAATTDLDPDTLRLWESARVDPPLPELVEYCARLDIDPVAFVARIDQRDTRRCQAIATWDPATRDPGAVAGEILAHLRRRRRLGVASAAALHGPTLGARTLARHESGRRPVPTGLWILLVRRLGGCPVAATDALLDRLAHLPGPHRRTRAPARVLLAPGARLVDLDTLATDPRPDAALLAGWANHVRADTRARVAVLDPVSATTLAALLDQPPSTQTAVLDRHPAAAPTLMPSPWRHQPGHGTGRITAAFGTHGHPLDLAPPPAVARPYRRRPNEATVATALGALLAAIRHHTPTPATAAPNAGRRLGWEAGAAPMTVTEFLRHCAHLGVSGAAVIAALDGTTATDLHRHARHHDTGRRPTVGALVTQALRRTGLDAEQLRALTPGPGTAITPHQGQALRVTRLYLTAGVLRASAAGWLAALDPHPHTRWRTELPLLTALVDDLAHRGVLDPPLLRADPRLPQTHLPTAVEPT